MYQSIFEAAIDVYLRCGAYVPYRTYLKSDKEYLLDLFTPENILSSAPIEPYHEDLSEISFRDNELGNVMHHFVEFADLHYGEVGITNTLVSMIVMVICIQFDINDAVLKNIPDAIKFVDIIDRSYDPDIKEIYHSFLSKNVLHCIEYSVRCAVISIGLSESEKVNEVYDILLDRCRESCPDFWPEDQEPFAYPSEETYNLLEIIRKYT